MPTALNSLRSLPPQFGHSVRESSVNACTTSSASPQSVHWYWYVGTASPSGTSSRAGGMLALAGIECQ